MIIVMNRHGVPTVGEASLPRKSGKRSPSHSVAAYEFLDLWVIVSLARGRILQWRQQLKLYVRAVLETSTPIGLMDIFKGYKTAVLFVFIVLVVTDETYLCKRAVRRLNHEHPFL